MNIPPTISRRKLRLLLDATLRTDAELEAFCIDYFPVVKRQFASAMDRTTRLNLLLETVDPGRLLEALREHNPQGLTAQISSETVTLGETSHRGVTPPPGDGALNTVSDRLSALYTERTTLLSLGHDTAAVNDSILQLRRQQRQGPQLQAGDFLGEGQYRLLARIGRGGFSTVWLALASNPRQPGATERVALKVLHSDLAADPTHVERFYRGARRMAELQHPHIVRVIDPPRQEQGFHYFVMPLLEGGDLQRAISTGKLSTTAAIKAVLQAGEALTQAHAVGLIHRDVKPENILLTLDGSAQLTDFDLVLADDTTGGTRTGALGTFLFAAPESLEDARCANIRSDVYSLGMTLASVLYRRRLPQQVLTNQVAFFAQLPCNAVLRAVIRRAIAPEPSARYGSIAELCAAIAASAGSDIGAQAISAPAKEGRLAQRQGSLLLLLGITALVGATAGYFRSDRRIPASLSGVPRPLIKEDLPAEDLGTRTFFRPAPVVDAVPPLDRRPLPQRVDALPASPPSAPPVQRKGEPGNHRQTDRARSVPDSALTTTVLAPVPPASPAQPRDDEIVKPQLAKPSKELHEEDWAVH